MPSPGRAQQGHTGRLDNNEKALLTAQEKPERLQDKVEAHDERRTRGEQAPIAADEKIVQASTDRQQQEERITRSEAEDAKISTTAREALERAITAGKPAKGKLVYESVMSEVCLGFCPDRTELSDESKQALERMAHELNSENIYLEIQGHTDSLGTPDMKQRLGRLVAEALRNFPHQNGIP